MFVQGYSIDTLVRQNPNYGSVALGLISQARIEYSWDQERQTYIGSLMASTRASAEKSALESLQFAMDGMAVYHRLIGNRFKQYLQSGKDEDLGEWAGMSFSTYLKLVDLYRGMSGKDTSKSAKVSVEVSAVATPVTPKTSEPEPEEAPMSAEKAMDILTQMTTGKN